MYIHKIVIPSHYSKGDTCRYQLKVQGCLRGQGFRGALKALKRLEFVVTKPAGTLEEGAILIGVQR